MSFDVEMVPTTSLAIHPDNRKYFADIEGELWSAFVQDIAEHGIREPLTVDRLTGCVIKGNQRLRAAQELGIAEVPVMYRDYASPDEAVDDLIRDNVIRRDIPFFQKYRLVAALQERIASRQGEGGGELSHAKYDPPTSVQNGQKSEAPRDQISKLLGLHKNDIAVANILATLSPEVQSEFYHWANENDPTKKEAQEKIRELHRVKKELRELKDLKKLAAKKEELERGMEILMREGQTKLSDAESASRITAAIADGWTWLQHEAGALLTIQATPSAISACAPLVQEFMHNLDAYREALVKKFTGRDA